MQKNASSRNNLAERFKDNELFRLINHVGNKYQRPACAFRLPPLDIFEMVVGWLDKISREPEDEEVEMMLDMAWGEIRSHYQGMAEEKAACDDAMLDEMTCTTLCLLMRCLDMLSENHVASNGAYSGFSHAIGNFLDSSYLHWEDLYCAILTDKYHKHHRAELQGWLEEYMNISNEAYTDKDGMLKSCFTKNDKKLGRIHDELFCKKGTDKECDERAVVYWTGKVHEFIKYCNRNLSDCVIDTKRDSKGRIVSFATKTILAFVKYWEQSPSADIRITGTSLFYFFYESCKFQLPINVRTHQIVKDKSVSDKLTKLLQQDTENDSLTVHAKLEKFMKGE